MTTKTCTEAVSRASFGGWVQCRTNSFSGGGEEERRAHIPHGVLAVTTPVAEASPASSEPLPGALLPLGMLGGIWDRQTPHFPFWSQAAGQRRVTGFGHCSLVVSPSGQPLSEPHHRTELLFSRSPWPGYLALLRGSKVSGVSDGESPGPVSL